MTPTEARWWMVAFGLLVTVAAMIFGYGWNASAEASHCGAIGQPSCEPGHVVIDNWPAQPYPVDVQNWPDSYPTVVQNEEVWQPAPECDPNRGLREAADGSCVLEITVPIDEDWRSAGLFLGFAMVAGTSALVVSQVRRP